jgi:hypothetical protein
MTNQPIVVSEIEDGDFIVVRGGDILRRWKGQVVPGQVKAGETASAAEICEWIECGVSVEDALAIAKAGFRTYAQHSQLCPSQNPNRWGDTGECECGFTPVSAAIAKATA